MTRARILADYVSSGDELALKAPLISPALVTPNLGTPSAGVMTNATGLVATTGLTASGTKSSGTFLRGDNTWDAPSSSPTCAFAYKSALQQSDCTNLTTVVYATEVFDVGDDFGGTNFVAPVDGIYLFNASVRMTDLPTNAVYTDLRMYFSGGQPLSQTFLKDMSEVNDYASMQCTVMADMDATHTCYAALYFDGPTDTINIIAGDGTRFCGYLIG